MTFNCEQLGFLRFWGGVDARTVTAIDKARIFEEMSKLESNEPQPNEDQLENLLDEQSDEEFGLPEFSEHVSEPNGPVVLKDWTAQDFASIYVRFRPHLERHAKRYLVNPSQVEEVVQDAFLYLMTTLPELDSEIGVLKFLKWKTRLLALDVIRANSRVSLAPLDADREFEADLPESSHDLERADDAAIVSLALAKLQPRHREALIATLYEEKSAALVSAQMGMSENAFRQLLFRSRAAFKKALIGEAETAGLSMSAVLSIAARKAAAESGKYISAAGAFLLVLGISIGVLPNLAGDSGEQSSLISQPESLSPAESGVLTETQIDGAASSAIEESEIAEISTPDPLENGALALQPPVDAGSLNGAPDEVSDSSELPSQVVEADSRKPEGVERDAIIDESLAIMKSKLGDDVALALAARNDLTNGALVTEEVSDGQLVITGSTGLTSHITYDHTTKTGISRVWFTLEFGDEKFVAAPRASYSLVTQNLDGTFSIDYASTDLLVGDATGAYMFTAVEDSEVSRMAVKVTILVSATGKLVSASQELIARTTNS